MPFDKGHTPQLQRLCCVGLEDLTLKPKQEEALIYMYHGHDVFAWFPTGYGKSLCFQLLPFMLDFKPEADELSKSWYKDAAVAISEPRSITYFHSVYFPFNIIV